MRKKRFKRIQNHGFGDEKWAQKSHRTECIHCATTEAQKLKKKTARFTALFGRIYQH